VRVIYQPGGEAREYAQLGLNLYEGCSHGCSYCYNNKNNSDNNKGRFNGSCNKQFLKANLTNIDADLRGLAYNCNCETVHLSFVGDPYDLGRVDNSFTRAVLELFKKYHHSFQILTKGGIKAVQDFDLYSPDDLFGCTLTFDNAADSIEREPGAALPADRIEALRIAHERGIKTWVSLEPVIIPEQTLHLIDLTHDFVDFYGVGRWNHDDEADEIDWRKFRADAETRLRKYKKDYTIKAALKWS
jgi:DNA repair photolyase